MAELKSVAKDTAIYGLSSIIGKFLNYLLVPLYTAKMTVESGGYGIVTNIYAYVALLMVILTFGMETTLFRFANKEGENPQTVYGTTLTMVGSLSLLFALLVLAFLHPIASGIGYADHPEYVGIMAITVALDAFQAIPFAWLRYQHRPIKFFALKMLFIVLNITLNILYFVVLPALYVRHAWVGAIYDPSVGPGYAFILNLVCTSFITFFFIPELTGFKYRFDTRLMKRMLGYSWPILILGIAGILNQTADKIIFPLVYGDAEAAKSELGIYGACVKIAMIMAMITQAFRYAYEPFVFGKAKDKNSGETYATVMKFFIIFTLLAYLCVIGYMDILKRIIAPDYWPGLRVVPIVMAAEIMMGVYFNLSFWYKLIDKTIWGAWFSAARLFGPLCRQHHLHPDVQLHGMCLGRFRRIRHGHAPVLHRGTEEKPRPISVEIHRHLRTDCRRLLRHHGLYARRMARMDTTGYQHGAHPALRRTYPETRPTGTKPTGHRQIFS